MAQRWKIKTKKSFRENAYITLPAMYDRMMSYAEKVIDHPNLKEELHRMRIAGKPLRYAMEIYETIFGETFRKKLEEVKHVLELMGDIHDCDVNIPVLRDYLREIVLFNKSVPDRKQTLPTRLLRSMIADMRSERIAKFNELCPVLRSWNERNYREELIASMES